MHVAIIGNGITGVTAALRLREKQPTWRISLVSGESTYHFSRPALMYVFMGHMRYQDTKPFPDSHWVDKGIDLVRAWVKRIDVAGKKLELHTGGELAFDKLLIATGSKSNMFGWPGQDLDGVQGLWGLPDLKKLYETAARTSEAVIVGGGLIGIELAEMLHSRGIHVSFLVRERSYWNNILPNEESAMINEAIQNHGMELLLQTELDEILDDGKGRARGIRTKDGREIPCQLVGLTAGVSPNIGVVDGTSIETGRGILVDDSLRTSVPDVLAAGDCAEIRRPDGERNLIQQVWYTGKMQGEVAADVLSGEQRSYSPSIWFNSAKFLDLEYHTYGKVNLNVPGERNLFWKHPSEPVAVRVVYTDEGVVGFNTMGLRWRHEVCERWLADQAPVHEVLPRLAEANFDPELYARHESTVQRTFETQLAQA